MTCLTELTHLTYLTIAPPVVPSTRQSVQELATLERFVKEANTLTEVDGFNAVPVGRDGDNIDAAITAWRQLRDALGAAYVEPASLYLLGQMEDAGWERLPNFRVISEAGLAPQVRVLQLKSGNSAAPLDALALAASTLAQQPEQTVGLVAAEKVNSRFVRRRVGSQIFGDSAIAALASAKPLTEQLPTLRLLGKPVSLTDPRFFEMRPGGLIGDPEFLDSARRISHEVTALAMRDAGVTAGDVAWCCTQNLSERLFQHIDAERPLPGKPIRYREQLAHAPCVDLFANVSLAWSAGRLPRASIVLISALGRGIGGSAAVFHVE
jgi:hypothetical protein